QEREAAYLDDADRLPGVHAGVAARLPDLTADPDLTNRPTRRGHLCLLADERLRADDLAPPAHRPVPEQELADEENETDREGDEAPRRGQEDQEHERENQEHSNLAVDSRVSPIEGDDRTAVSSG